MNRWWKAVILGCAFVCIVILLNRHHLATSITFWLLLPGLAAASTAPDFDVDFKSAYPWGPIARCIFYAVNIALYTGIAYILLSFIHRLRISK